MPCYKPIKGWRSRHPGINGGFPITFNRSESIGQFLNVPCGRCIGCRIEKSEEWAARCQHEASLYQENCFITLTYADENLPEHCGLNRKHFQNFMKRLRQEYQPKKIRFFMCGEYGTKEHRPHYHAILFNHDFPDKYIHKQGYAGNNLYRSKTLEKLWKFGYSSIGEMNYKTANYVARYTLKKTRSTSSDYEFIDKETGEVIPLEDEYITCSLRPGIGYSWFHQFKTDVYPDDFIIMNGKKKKVPHYYSELFKRMNPEQYEQCRKKRIARAYEHAENSSDARLEVREKCVEIKLKNLKRQLEQ